MSKLLILALILVATGAIATGVVEVQLHPEKAASAPNTVLQYIASGNLYEQGRVLAISLKRKLELYSAQNDEQKMEIMLGFVREDAARLEKLTSNNPNPEKIVPQTKMLAKSIEQVQQQGTKLQESALANFRGPSEEAFAQAAKALALVDELQQKAQQSAQDLADTINNVNVPTPEGDNPNSGQVAGAQDENQSTQEQATPSPAAKIPLRF